MLLETNQFDLTAASKALNKVTRFRGLVGLIKQRQSLLSVNRDVEYAFDIINAIAEVSSLFGIRAVSEQTMQNPVEAHTIASLLNNAILKYTGAMHSDSIAAYRWKVGVKEMPNEIKTAHRRISTIRDKILAHYGETTDDLAIPWNIDIVVMTLEGEQLITGHAYMRTNYLQSIYEEAAMLITWVHHSLTDRVVQGQAEFDAAIAEALRDPECMGIISKYPADLATRRRAGFHAPGMPHLRTPPKPAYRQAEA